jgi:hypothetical protein
LLMAKSGEVITRALLLSFLVFFVGARETEQPHADLFLVPHPAPYHDAQGAAFGEMFKAIIP